MYETLSYWNDCYDKRLAWAYESRDNFISEIGDENFKSLYNKKSNGTVNIAVYGKSQVGKTTLILKLIGIKEKYYEKVSNILRADIPQGSSVTPTSIIYSRSNDNFFHYHEGKIQHCLNGADLKLKLKNLRQRVENNIEIDNLENSESKVLIKIPFQYFEESLILDLNIIDLPGYGSANEKEHKHVQKVIKDVRPILNLVLIVSDKVTDLVNCTKPCNQFRYVLTRSVSKASVRKRFEKNIITNKKNYVEYVRSEFETLSEREKVYPLEYGDSWSKLDNKIKIKAERIILELFKDLRTDISESSTEYNQLMQNANYYIDIQKKIRLERERLSKSIERKNEEIKKLNNSLISLKTLIDNSLNEIVALNKSSCQIKKYSFDFNFYQFRGDITVGNLKSYVLNFIDEICQRAYGDWKFHEKYIEEEMPKFVQISLNIFSKMLSKLNSYIFDWYITNQSEKDKKECEAVCAKIFNTIKNKVEFKIELGIRSNKKLISNEIKEKNIKLKKYTQKTDKLITKLEIKKKELDNLKFEKKLYITQSSKDLNTAKKFKDYIEIGYLKEKNKLIQIINSRETSRETKFLKLLNLSLISSEFEKLIKQPI